MHHHARLNPFILAWDNYFSFGKIALVLGKLIAIFWENYFSFAIIVLVLGKLIAIFWESYFSFAIIVLVLGKLIATFWDNYFSFGIIILVLEKLFQFWRIGTCGTPYFSDILFVAFAISIHWNKNPEWWQIDIPNSYCPKQFFFFFLTERFLLRKGLFQNKKCSEQWPVGISTCTHDKVGSPSEIAKHQIYCKSCLLPLRVLE